MHRRDGESVDRMASKTRPINPHAAETMMAARGVRKRPQWADFEADLGSNAIDCWWQNAESYEKHLALGTSEPPPPPAPCQGPAIDCRTFGYKKGEDIQKKIHRHIDECASRTGTLPHRSTRGTPAHRRQNDT